jgi:HEAT repeat protein
MTTSTADHDPWAEMRAAALTLAESVTAGRPRFHFRLTWPESYESLLESAPAPEADEQELLHRALSSGRVIVSAEAGSGKTWLLARTSAAAAASGEAIPIWIPLRTLLAVLPDSPSSRADGTIVRTLLSLAQPDPRSALGTAGRAPKILILADGLNEIPKDTAEPVVDALDELARSFPFVSVIVTDRLVRRPIPLDRWLIATVLPLSEDEVRRVWAAQGESRDLPDDLELLRRPFFLDTVLVTDLFSESRAAAIDTFFTQRVSLTASELALLSEVAFRAYAEYHGRTVPLFWFEQRVPPDMVTQLEEAGALRTGGDRAWFAHHLLHDFLAARALVARREQWGPQAFGVVTLGAASFDALRLAVEQLPDTESADLLVRRIYDWNYYGAAYALSGERVSQEIRVAVLAMLADKKWDLVTATAATVSDALRVDRSVIAKQLLAAKDREQLFDVINAQESANPWFNRWREIFTIPDGTPAGPDLVVRLQVDDSFAGWTLANVLRRCRLGPESLNEILRIATDGSNVERWRAAHVLGAHPSGQSAGTLLTRLADNDEWVRYGAVRSIVEIAAQTNDMRLREYLIIALTEAVQQGGFDSRMLNELERALDIRPQPPEWPASIATLVQQLIGSSERTSDQERWGRVMALIAQSSSEDE